MAVKSKTADAATAAEDAVITTPTPEPDQEPVQAPIKGEPPKKKARPGAGFCAYIGPTILGVIQSGAVYPGTKADALATIAPAVEKRPLIASLVVDGETLPTDRIKVKTPGNLLYVNAQKLAAGKK